MVSIPKPNGFADDYPVFKWLAIIGNINPTFSGPNPYTPEISQIKKPKKKKVETLRPVPRWTERRGILLGCLGPRESPVRRPGGLK